MCGIIGYIGERDAAPFLVDALKRLEYRGYDSAGVATIDKGTAGTADSKLHLKKEQGEINPIEQNVHLSKLPGSVGIGHTRWATCGAPSKENAHPHVDCKNEIAIVHNGIIENYIELRDELKKQGHSFKSETDSEVVTHLIEENYKNDFEAAFVSGVKKLKGSYAIAVIHKNEPDKILAARNKSPLVLGISSKENFIASDIPAFLTETKQVVILENEEYAIISPSSFQVKSLNDSSAIKKEVKEITWNPEAAEKGGFNYFALKEIEEIPKAVEETLASGSEIQKVLDQIKNYTKIIFTACGTSYHASLLGKYLLERLTNISTHAVIASEFAHSSLNAVDDETLVIALSQSGETADTLQAVKRAREKGAKILSITNVLASSLERVSDFSLHTHAGPEVAVIATKTFVTQLVVLYCLAINRASKPINDLGKIPVLIRRTVDSTKPLMEELAEQLKDKEDIYFIGRGLAYPLVLEGALKLKEISYIHAEGMPAGELKHGTLSLIEKGTPVVVSLIQDETYERTLANMDEVRARGGYVIAVTSDGDADAKNHADEIIYVPKTDPLLAPLVQIIPLQLLAYYTTIARGLNPDKPRNLAKSVTVE